MFSIALAATSSFGLGVAVAQILARRRRHSVKVWPRFVGMPNPDWQPGEPQPSPYGDSKKIAIDPSAATTPELYTLVVSAIVPRPTGFLTTISTAGDVNAAPFSYFNMMCHDPCVVAVGICRSPARNGGKKDTLQNIEETGEFVVNILSEWYVNAANYCCGDFDRGVDELAITGLTKVASTIVRPPCVAEAAVQLECKVLHMHEIPGRNGAPHATVVLGKVVLLHVADSVATRSPRGKLMVDPLKLRAVVRLGGNTYGRVTELFDLPRPLHKDDEDHHNVKN